MKMESTLLKFGLAMTVATCLAVSVSGQCFTNNDLAVTESIPTSVSRLLDGFTKFAIDLYKDVVEKNSGSSGDQNVFISPISIWSSLALTFLGAQGNTEMELARALGVQGMNKAGAAKGYQVLKVWYFLRTENQDANYTFRMANKLFFQEEEELRQCMLTMFKTEIKRVNFVLNPETARNSINYWVEEQTSGKIKDLVPQGYVDRTTRMVLVNAAYFKGDWEKEFNPSMSEEDDFHVGRGQIIPVRMMSQDGSFPYAKTSILKSSVIELPYSGRELSMLILLPYKNVTAENVVSSLSAEALHSVFAGLSPRSVHLRLPKFHIEQALDLKSHIMDMGVQDLFDGSKSDLSGFTGKSDFSVSEIRHKTFVTVNEEGTEAAAATGFVVFRTTELMEPVIVNRPFVFLIRDNILDTILFIGLVRHPKDEA